MGKKKQTGQTLIETMVAAFILIMGITAASSLATFSLDNSTEITKEIVGTGLAREALEAVKNMRDTNWLWNTLSNQCYNYVTNQPTGGNCYQNWLTAYYTIPNSSSGSTNTLQINLTPGQKFWSLQSPGSNLWGLNLNTNTTNTLFTEFYIPSGASVGTSGYYREVTITAITTSPFNETYPGPELKVTSQVWWIDKRCPASPTWPTASGCKIELDEYLTNWRDF